MRTGAKGENCTRSEAESPQGEGHEGPSESGILKPKIK